MRSSVTEHQASVRAALEGPWRSGILGPAEHETVPLAGAVGRVLATDLHAPVDLPPFANSAMDGYALHVSTEQPGHARDTALHEHVVAATIPAGTAPPALRPGHAAPIMTGAMVPAGATAIVPVEQATPARFLPEGALVRLPAPAAGAFVRPRGSDLALGQLAIAAGTRLNAGHVGLASALGVAALTVRRAPRVLLLTTGDEVLLPGDPRTAHGLPAGKIYDANRALLRANLEQAGMEVISADLVPDEPPAFTAMLERYVGADGGSGTAGLPPVDVIVSTGGISAGAFEVVKQSLHPDQVRFVSVALQPGGPQAVGHVRGVPFLGFPGNPVSAVVSFELFLRPVASELLGAPAPRPRVLAALAEPLQSPAGKHQLRRGVYEGPSFEARATVREVGGPSSHLVAALAAANALFHVPAGVTELQAGAKVEVWLL